MKRTSTRPLQFVFVIVLAISIGQVAWWVFDSVQHATDVRNRITALLEVDALAANRMLADGEDRSLIVGAFPHLRFDGDTAVVRPTVLQSLANERFHRMNRMIWEGAFFLAVLLGALAMIVHPIRQDSRFRQRQRNFVAAVTHELKSPLASLRLATETLSLRGGDPAQRERLTDRMLTDIDRLNALVSNVLDASRLERGDVRATSRVTVAQEVEATVNEIEHRVKAHGVQLETRLETDAAIHGDPLGVRTAVRNVLDNSLKATLAVREGRIQVETRSTASHVEVVVEDNGIGFDPSEAERIFERFYRPGNEMQREMSGTGLGLYIVRRQMELDGGTATARSDGPGKGATVTLRWPRLKEPTA